MNGLRVILLFALLVALSWFILSGIVTLTYNYIEYQNKQCSIPPKAFIWKAANDSTDYNNLTNGECFCEKVTCAKKCTRKSSKLTMKSFSSFLPYYITENITAEKLCPFNITPYRLDHSDAHVKNGYLIVGSEKLKQFCVVKNGIFKTCLEPKQPDCWANQYITIGK